MEKNESGRLSTTAWGFTFAAVLSVFATLFIGQVMERSFTFLWAGALVLAIATSAVAAGLWLTKLCRVLFHKGSPYVIIGILDALTLAGVTAYCLYDRAREGVMAGFVGSLGLVFVVPALGAVLLIDIIAGLVRRARKTPEP